MHFLIKRCLEKSRSEDLQFKITILFTTENINIPRFTTIFHLHFKLAFIRPKVTTILFVGTHFILDVQPNRLQN